MISLRLHRYSSISTRLVRYFSKSSSINDDSVGNDLENIIKRCGLSNYINLFRIKRAQVLSKNEIEESILYLKNSLDIDSSQEEELELFCGILPHWIHQPLQEIEKKDQYYSRILELVVLEKRKLDSSQKSKLHTELKRKLFARGRLANLPLDIFFKHHDLCAKEFNLTESTIAKILLHPLYSPSYWGDMVRDFTIKKEVFRTVGIPFGSAFFQKLVARKPPVLWFPAEMLYSIRSSYSESYGTLMDSDSRRLLMTPPLVYEKETMLKSTQHIFYLLTGQFPPKDPSFTSVMSFPPNKAEQRRLEKEYESLIKYASSKSSKRPPLEKCIANERDTVQNEDTLFQAYRKDRGKQQQHQQQSSSQSLTSEDSSNPYHQFVKKVLFSDGFDLVYEQILKTSPRNELSTIEKSEQETKDREVFLRHSFQWSKKVLENLTLATDVAKRAALTEKYGTYRFSSVSRKIILLVSALRLTENELEHILLVFPFM